jgi:hypothetical protein
MTRDVRCIIVIETFHGSPARMIRAPMRARRRHLAHENLEDVEKHTKAVRPKAPRIPDIDHFEHVVRFANSS